MAAVVTYPYSHGETVTRLRGAAGPPPYNETNWSSPLKKVYANCAVWQESSTEPVPDADGRATIVTVTKCAVPFDADFLPGDRFEVRGVIYEQIGEAQRLHNPFTGWEPAAIVVGRWLNG